MSLKHFPGLPPYVDPGLEARGVPEDVRGGLRSAWPVRRVEGQLAALATIDAIPGDQKAALQAAFDDAATLIVGQAVSLEGQVEAATMLASAHGLDASALKAVGPVFRPVEGESGPETGRDLYLAKAKDLEAKLDEARREKEAAESRAKLAENAASRTRSDVAFLSNQVANLRAVIATKDAEAARVKAGFEAALEQAKAQRDQAFRPEGELKAAAAPEAKTAPETEKPPEALEAPEATVQPEAASPSPSPEAPTSAGDEGEPGSGDDPSSRPAKNGRKAR